MTWRRGQVWPFDKHSMRNLLPILLVAGVAASVGCRSPHVIRSDEFVSPAKAGETFVAPMDGWFLSDALYCTTGRRWQTGFRNCRPRPIRCASGGLGALALWW